MDDFAKLVAEYEHRKERETIEQCRQDITAFLTIFPDGKPLMPMTEDIFGLYLAFTHAQTTLERLARKRRQMAAASAIEELLRDDNDDKSDDDDSNESNDGSEDLAEIDDVKADASSDSTRNGIPSPLISTSEFTPSKNGRPVIKANAKTNKPIGKNGAKAAGLNGGSSKPAIDETVGDTESAEKSDLNTISIADNGSENTGDDALPYDEEILPFT